jgi:histone-binding protein RBBP4
MILDSPANKFYSIRRLLLGTHTSGQSRDYLQIATVQLPNSDSSSKSSEKDKDNEGSQPQSKLRITQRINHKGEVNRARYMPQNPDLIATKSVSGSVLFFDRTKHALDEAEKDGVCRPELELVGQELEGYVSSLSFFLSFRIYEERLMG